MRKLVIVCCLTIGLLLAVSPRLCCQWCGSAGAAVCGYVGVE